MREEEVPMPYEKNSDLPDNVKSSLPAHAQDIYRKTFNAAWGQYKDAEDRQEGRSREETAHAVAWAAVKHQYEKDGNDKWKRKAA